MVYDESAIQESLRKAVGDLKARGQQLSSRWVLEQLLGMNPSAEGSDGQNRRRHHDPLSQLAGVEADIIDFALNLLAAGEYQRCSHFLTKVKAASKASMCLEGVYLSYYALYMSGEKLKSQQMTELEEAPANSYRNGNESGRNMSGPKNPYLVDLFREMHPLYLEYITRQKESELRQTTEQSNARAQPSRRGSGNAAHSSGDSKVPTSTDMPPVDGFILYLFGVVVRDLRLDGGGPINLTNNHPLIHLGSISADLMVPSVYDIFVESLRSYPWNWSCWLDLAALCVTEQRPTPTWNDLHILKYHNKDGTSTHSDKGNLGSSSTLPTSMNADVSASHSVSFSQCRVMYDFFYVHICLEHQLGEPALKVLQRLVQVFPNSHYVASQAALAHYAMRDYDRAQSVFEEMRSGDPHRLSHIDTYSNILYVKEKKAELSHLAHSLVKVDKYAPETCCVVGNYYSLKAKHERAILYFQRALRTNPKFLSAWTLMGHEYVELRNTAAAVHCYRKVYIL